MIIIYFNNTIYLRNILDISNDFLNKLNFNYFNLNQFPIESIEFLKLSESFLKWLAVIPVFFLN